MQNATKLIIEWIDITKNIVYKVHSFNSRLNIFNHIVLSRVVRNCTFQLLRKIHAILLSVCLVCLCFPIPTISILFLSDTGNMFNFAILLLFSQSLSLKF